MSKRVMLCAAALVLGACSEENPATQPYASDAGPEFDAQGLQCTEEELSPSPDGAPVLSENAYEALLYTGLFVGEADVMTVSYHEGYNLNFEISEADARSLLPCNLTPMRLKLLESDPEARYYLSWYLAVLEPNESPVQTTRIDLFTYAYNEEGEPALHFVSSYMGVPDDIRNDETMFGMFEEIFDFFANDSRTGKAAYPHYYTNTLSADDSTFLLVYGDSRIELTPCPSLSKDEEFTRLFIAANSQIYRTAIDKNVNYFNQSFMRARVETRDAACVHHQNLAGFHPLLRDLRSVHFYGNKAKKITWYYEMCSAGDCGNPFK